MAWKNLLSKSLRRRKSTIHLTIKHREAAAEQAHAVDAASRPQDRGFFETQNRHEVSTDLLAAAQLMGKPLGHTLLKQFALDMLLRCEVLKRFSLVLIPTLFLAACSALSPSPISNATSPPAATADPFMGSPERIASIPFPAVTLPEQPDPNFAFSIGYGACTITRILDTFTGTLAQHSMDGSSASITFRLTPDERVIIYQAMKTINLFGYPNVYAIVVPENTMQIMTEPHPRYELILRNGTLNKTITWEDSISRPTTIEADQLRSFIERIRTLVANHPETAQLPLLREGCA